MKVREPSLITAEIGPLVLELAKSIRKKPFLLHKVQDVAVLMRDVTISIKDS